MSLRAPPGAWQSQGTNNLEVNEGSPHPHSRVRDDMRYTIGMPHPGPSFFCFPTHKFYLAEQVRPSLSLRAPPGAWQSQGTNSLEVNEGSPHPHSRVRDDAGYTIALNRPINQNLPFRIVGDGFPVPKKHRIPTRADTICPYNVVHKLFDKF